jgi:hypothetical protein
MLGLGLGLNINKQLQGFENLVKSAGGVSYYDAHKDLIIANGVTPDRSGKGNDITWANYAGTGASGLVIENGKVFRRLDGTDDFGSMVNTASIDITSAPLAVFATFKISSSVVSNGFIFAKNLNATANIQYSLYYSTAGNNITTYMEGIGRGATTSSSIVKDVPYNVGYIWDSTNVKFYQNMLQNGSTTAFAGALTSRPNARVGKEEGAGFYLKCDLATLTIYTGAKATESNILKAEKALSKAYI